MHFRLAQPSEPSRRDSALTPMIDVVFQLLAFFILTFRFVVPEGDFDIAMPAAAASPSPVPPLVEPLHVHLAADTTGALADIRINGRSLGPDVDALHRQVAQVAGIEGPANLRAEVEVKLDCDPQLHYEHTLAALAAISAYIDPAGNQATLIHRVQFARSKRA